MNTQLSDDFTYKKLIKFTLPSVLTMIFSSVYTTVDGLFISNFVGDMAFASVNFILPFLFVFIAVSFMFGAGGSALIGKTLGEGNVEKANEQFSLFVYVLLALGVVFSVVGFIFIRPIASFLGASDLLIDNAVLYGRILLCSLPFWMIQFASQNFFVTAGKPNLGFICTLIPGITNVVLDVLFVAVFKWGIVGAGVATAINQIIGGTFPLIYFARKNDSLLKLTKTKLHFKTLIQASYNGLSEFLSNVAASVTGILYNAQLMKYAGENGVSAYGTILYVNMLFFAVFFGISIGSAPIISYNYGAQNKRQLKNVFKKSLTLISVTSVIMFIASLILAKPLSIIFVGYNETLTNLTTRAFNFYSFVFLFAGVAIYGSAFFTALNNGLVSLIISFLRFAVFQVIFVLILPIFWGTDGIWTACSFAELCSFILAIICIFVNKKRYGY